MTKYQIPRTVRRESRTPVSKIKAGLLYPSMIVGIRPSEAGLVSHQITFELDPVMGRMLTPVFAEATAIFVPVEAVDAIKDPEAQFAGLSEVVRQKLLTGNPLFDLETEGVISQMFDVTPQSIGGVKKVTEAVRLSYNVAVNHLRQRKYIKASLLAHTNAVVTPALLSETILHKLNGVLNPDPKIGGQVQLQLPSLQLPVSGLGWKASGGTPATAGDTIRQNAEIGNDTAATGEWLGTNAAVYMRNDTPGTPATGRPDVYAQMDEVMAGGISLNDLHVAELTDRITRQIRTIVDANPEYGLEYALRYVHGLSLDKEGLPWVVAHRREMFGRSVRPATDEAGVAGDVMRSDMVLKMTMTIPVPKTELGGFLVTLVSIKPDEVIPAQPHPILSQPWGLDNFVADELELDPVAVTVRELDADCLTGEEGNVMFYNGYNGLKKAYISYGLTRDTDPETVENKTRVWQLELPLSVTPENILYPATLVQEPWALTTEPICTVVNATAAILPTPMQFGPTPVEDLEEIDDADIFGEE